MSKVAGVDVLPHTVLAHNLTGLGVPLESTQAFRAAAAGQFPSLSRSATCTLLITLILAAALRLQGTPGPGPTEDIVPAPARPALRAVIILVMLKDVR